MTHRVLSEGPAVTRPSSSPPHPRSVDAGWVRALAGGDLSQVTAIYNRVFLKNNQPPSARLLSLLKDQFLPDGVGTGSLVYVRDEAVIGFVGSIPMTMAISGREVSVAVLTSLMMDDHESDPMGGAKLIRAMVSGPQDLTISETASPTSVAMWRQLRGTVLPGYSLDWLKILSPAGFVMARAANKAKLAQAAAPLARMIDSAISRRLVGPLHWRTYMDVGAKGFTSEDVSPADLAKIVDDLSSSYAARPVWSDGALTKRLAAASSKPLFGPAVSRVVLDRGAHPIGAFIFYGVTGGIGQVLQVLARSGRLGPVLDELFRCAALTGIVALRGRSDPTLLDGLLGRHCTFTNTSTTVAIARDKTLLDPLIQGQALITGLAGESWSPLVGSTLGP